MKTEHIRRHPRLSTLLLFLCFFLILPSCGGEKSDVPVWEPSSDIVARDLTIGIGAAFPEAGDYFASLPEGYRAELLTDYAQLTGLGKHDISLSVTDADGNTQTVTAILTLIRDTVPPVIGGTADISVQIGDGVAYRKNVTVSDNCFGEIRLEVDSSAVKTDKEGNYPVIYTATDAAGNKTSVTVTVHVVAHLFTEEKLWALVDNLISSLMTDRMTTEEQCRVIYRYVQSSVAYTGSSDKSDWKQEAYHALTDHSGDCFSYFAVSKAFFERLGIENLDVERSAEVAAAVGERHYWSMVNIAAPGEAPLWYHFDSCRLAGVYVHSGCLLTDMQLDTYNRLRHNTAGVNNYFYAYDREKFPATSVNIITPTPELEPYD